MHIENSVMNCLEQLQQFQSELMKNLKDVKDDKEKVKEYDKQLDACCHLIQSMIKFKRSL